MRRALGAVLGIVTLVAAACGGGGGDDGAAIVRAAAARTTAASSSRMAITATAPGTAAGTVRGEGAFDFATGRGSMTMQVPGFGSVEGVVDGVVFYVKLPMATGGKPWVRIDLHDVGTRAGIDVGALAQASQGDPTQALDFLPGASNDVTEVGRESVRGVRVTHYRATLDLDRAAEHADAEGRKALRDAVAALKTKAVAGEVWVDDKGRVRKLHYDVPGDAGSVTMELYDFGVAVDATPPPADQVADLGALLGRSG